MSCGPLRCMRRALPGGVILALLLALIPAPRATRAAEDPVVRLVELVNSERMRYGLQPLVVNYSLMDSAQAYAQVLAGGWCWGHYCGLVPNPSERARRAGYRGPYYVGENIAYGVNTPEAVFAMWMRSYWHRAAILSPHWTEIGIGVASRGYTMYWTQQFGSGRPAPPPDPTPLPELQPVTPGATPTPPAPE